MGVGPEDKGLLGGRGLEGVGVTSLGLMAAMGGVPRLEPRGAPGFPPAPSTSPNVVACPAPLPHPWTRKGH